MAQGPERTDGSSIPEAVQKTNDAAVDPVTENLKTSRTVAVVGLSNRRFRPSHGVAEYLQSAGYRIVPANPQEREVLGENLTRGSRVFQKKQTS